MMSRSKPLQTTLSVLFGLSGCAAAASAEDYCWCQEGRVWAAEHAGPEVYDPATGRDELNYAPSRVVDLDHMKLTLSIADMNTPVLTATEELTFSPIGAPVEVLTLDAVGFTLGEITGMAGAEIAGTSYDGNRLQIRFTTPIAPGQAAGVRIEYTLNDPVDGLFWTPESDAWIDRPAQIHTQGQPETNRFWFATHDSPNERLTTEVIATVPEGYLASSNGRLVSEKTEAGSTTFHWMQDKAHSSYLTSLVVGKFDVVDVGHPGLQMPVYVPPGRAGDVDRTYGRTAEMVRVFEERFDEPYPWDRYAQLVVWNFGAGGMENTSATTMYDTAIYNTKDLIDGDLEGLISHELGHQWFGDLLTCTSWADIWLNEGFATYSTSLWYEARDGYDEGYLRQALANFDRFSNNDRLASDDERAGLRVPMVSRAYHHPWEVFRRAANPYPKGSSVLHMLRMKLGDDVFFRGLAEYVDRYKGQTVETDQFRRAMEDVSGLSLTQFFEQWTHRPGVPEIEFSADYDLASHELTISVAQTQRIDEFVPAFTFDLPVLITRADGAVQEITIHVDTDRHERTVSLEEEPAMVVVNPELDVLARIELQIPERWLTTQLQLGPTVPSRILAARALGSAGPDAIQELTYTLYETTNHYSVRGAAANALADNGEFTPLHAIAGDRKENARVRAATINALTDAEADGPLFMQTYRKLALSDEVAYGVRAAALRACGLLGDERDLGILKAALGAESRDDVVRQAAIRGLRDLDLPESLDLIQLYVEPGTLSRTRPVAIQAISELAKHNREKAYDIVEPWLTDPREARTRTAAITALVKIEDERGVERLRKLGRTHEHPVDRERCTEAATTLAAALAANAEDASLHERLEKLEQRLGELEAKDDD